jgi:hypothetical protein
MDPLDRWDDSLSSAVICQLCLIGENIVFANKWLTILPRKIRKNTRAWWSVLTLDLDHLLFVTGLPDMRLELTLLVYSDF